MGLKSGICPQCNSSQIYVSEGKFTAIMRSRGHAILAKEAAFAGHKYVLLKHYVCLNCHYIETYAHGQSSINNILENWQPLNKEKRKNEE
jgi:predicted nucleic-acid-binding Zn-ribbon protein